MIVTEKSEEPFHCLHRSWEIEIKSELVDDVHLQLNELLLSDVFSFFVGKQVDHSIEAWRNGLFQLCGHENADYRKVQNV